MNSRLDELFSTDRLRQNWETSKAPVKAEQQCAKNAAIQNQYLGLLELIAKTFPDSSRLATRFEDISASINQTFPLNTTTNVVETEKKLMLVGMLEELEELLWSMSLSKGNSL